MPYGIYLYPTKVALDQSLFDPVPPCGMHSPSPLRRCDLERKFEPIGCNPSSNQWQSQEEFTVADVFAPQTMEDVDPSIAQEPPNDSSDGKLGGSNNGFRMGPSPKKPGSNLQKDGDTNKKKKNKKKKGLKDVFGPIPTKGFMPPGENDVSGNRTEASKTASPQPLPPCRPKNTVSRPPSANGVSALKQQLDALSVGGSRSSSKLGSDASSSVSEISESDQTEILTSYEVPLEHDFVSSDVKDEGEDSAFREEKKDALCRKMAVKDFDSLICLGKGTFGTVLLVKQKTSGALYAQKQFRKASLTVHKRLVEQTKTERTILESVNSHPFVVKLFYAFQDHEKLYLILEYAQGGELFTHLAIERMFSEDVAAFYMAEMVLALEHLHHNVGVIYRDLKPENCLLDAEGHLLLTDFGLSKVAVNDDDRCNSSLGTIEYMAPEVIQGKPYGKACDWWSLGALGFDLLTGSPPFKGNNHAKITEKILKQKLTIPYFLGPDAKDLLIRLLRKDPNKRLGYHMPKDMRTIKGHRFFRKIDWKALERREVEPPIKPIVTDPELAENFSPDFTSLSLSPILSSKPAPVDRDVNSGSFSEVGSAVPDDPFCGFSFVAPSSLLESGIASGNQMAAV